MRIAISGKSGCGNTTVSKELAASLGYPLINFTFRQLAEERGVSFDEICRLAEESFEIDRELDRRQVEMARKEENCVLASRLAVWMLDDADLKIYLFVPAEIRARRIHRREGGTYEEKLRETRNRDERDSRRYMELYSIDNDRPEDVADAVIDASFLSPSEIVSVILERVRSLAQEGE